MRQDWRELTYVHWPYPAEAVQSLLPEGLEVETFDGAAWVGLVPFRMVGIAGRGTPPIPYFGTFPETNVRTYVRGPAGPGVWFNSLDITRVLPVAVARLSYRLPYMWSKMRIERHTAGAITYRAERRWPGPRGVSSLVEVVPGESIENPSAFEHFLSARWRLYTMLRSRLAQARVSHEPWPLRKAKILDLHDEFVPAAGYPRPTIRPHVMHSSGVSVVVARPEFVSV
jgi:uncharacterized protein YqjF (DUF2071 family)